MQGPLQELQPLLLSVLPAARFRKAFLPQLLTVSAHAVPLITSTPTLRCHGYLCVLSPNNACNVIVLKRKQSLIHFKLKQRPSVLQRMQTQPGRWLLRATRGAHPRGAPSAPCRQQAQPADNRGLVGAGPPAPQPLGSPKELHRLG